MVGSVGEWVEGHYNEKAAADPEPPKTGPHHVLKGGGFLSHIKHLISSVHGGGPGDPLTTGFRIVKEVR